MARSLEQIELAMRVTLWVIMQHWNLRLLGPKGIARDLPWEYEEIATMMFGQDASDTRTEQTRNADGAESKPA